MCVFRETYWGLDKISKVIVQISNDNYSVEMNMNFLNTCSKIINKVSIRHRRWPINADNGLFAAIAALSSGMAHGSDYIAETYKAGAP